jgi:hypothetical protein
MGALSRSRAAFIVSFETCALRKASPLPLELIAVSRHRAATGKNASSRLPEAPLPKSRLHRRVKCWFQTVWLRLHGPSATRLVGLGLVASPSCHPEARLSKASATCSIRQERIVMTASLPTILKSNISHMPSGETPITKSSASGITHLKPDTARQLLPRGGPSGVIKTLFTIILQAQRRAIITLPRRNIRFAFSVPDDWHAGQKERPI